MRALVQRVNFASVSVENKLISKIDCGLLVFLGIKKDDNSKDRDYIIKKIINLRIFPDEQGKMNKNIADVNGEILLVSQFTLYGDCRKGNRPSFVSAMLPQQAKKYYDNFAENLKKEYNNLKEGVFGGYMQVELINDGPVTVLLDSLK